MDRLRYGSTCGILGIICNLLLWGGKLAAGFLSGSISVLADAWNNLSDAASSVVTVAGFRMAAKPADREHPFGHGRMEYVAGFVVAFLTLLVGVEVGKDAVTRIVSPVPVRFDLWTILVLLLSVAGKLAMACFYRRGSRKIGSEALRASARDSWNDALATGAVLLSALLMWRTDLAIDGYIGLLVAGYILCSGALSVKETLDPLLGQIPDQTMLEGIRQILLDCPEILDIHDLLVHNYGHDKWIASVHAEIPASADFVKTHDRIDRLEREVAERYPVRLTVHMDPVETENERTGALRTLAEEIARSICKTMILHDFRIVEGPSVTKLLFTLENPWDSGLSDGEVKQIFAEKLAKISRRYYAVITVEPCFSQLGKPGPEEK